MKSTPGEIPGELIGKHSPIKKSGLQPLRNSAAHPGVTHYSCLLL